MVADKSNAMISEITHGKTVIRNMTDDWLHFRTKEISSYRPSCDRYLILTKEMKENKGKYDVKLMEKTLAHTMIAGMNLQASLCLLPT